MDNSTFKNKPRLIRLLLAIAALSIIVRLLIQYEFDSSALLYIGIPFLASLILIHIRNPNEATGWKRAYLNRVIDAFIIMLGSSILLFEGFVCVVMFMPIYLIVILFMFLVDAFRQHSKKRGPGSFSVHLLPLILVLSAFEGVSPSLSYDRDEQVSVSHTIHGSVADIKQNLVQPISLQKPRPWFLQLFPMPHHVVAGSLSAGDVHEIHFKYYRWFIGNLHEGRMLLEISEVLEDSIRTTFLEDDSYISNYLQLEGTEIRMDEFGTGQTKITLSVHYQRTLDPYWYFAPIQRFAIAMMAEFLIHEVIARDLSEY